MTRVQQSLPHRRKLKNLRNLRSVVLGTPMHFRFTPSEVILKYEPNLEAHFNTEGKAFLNKIIMVHILQLYASKAGLAVCYEHLLESTFWFRNSASQRTGLFHQIDIFLKMTLPCMPSIKVSLLISFSKVQEIP